MSWPIPAPGETAERFYAGYEALRDADGRPLDLDPRQPNSVAGVQARVSDEVLFELWLYQASLADELMPDRATEWLSRHGDVWGVPRDPARYAIGAVLLRGTVGATVPSGILLDGGAVVTTAGGVVPVGGVLSVPAQAVVPGIAGNRDPGADLDFVSPVTNLSPSVAEVDADGLKGGTEIEAPEDWRLRILDRIADPPHGGKESDWRRWARQVGAAFVGVLPRWLGPGTVGLAVAMAGPRAPTTAELTAISATVDAERPVTAEPLIFAATLKPVDLTLMVRPDTVATRAALEAAAAAYLAREARVGGIRADGTDLAFLPRSRLSEALSAASGEYAHRVVAPAADVAFAATELPTLGAVTWTAWTAPS